MKNRQIFITGAGRGIGLAIADIFRKQGDEVIAPSRDELELSSAESVERYIKAHSRLCPSVMILNAGVNLKADIDAVTPDILQETFQVNLYSSIRLIQGYSGRIRENRGKIILISSLYSLVSREGRIAYASSKSALTGLMKTLALELAPDGVCVNAIAPGYVSTEMTLKNLSPGELAEIECLIPMRRLQEPEEIATLALFLASEENRSITGQLIAVDGGFLCR